MSSESLKIRHVSDTAVWVAHYRALETERPDALFRDPLAKVLTGARGEAISRYIGRTSRYTRWSVVIRTVVIDNLIRKLVAEGVDTVINLGAGLDTRPYRLELPESLRWIEVDYPNVVEHKENILRSEKPGVRLERVALDLGDLEERRKLFARLNAQARNALVLTEGVVPYLAEEQAASLARDLHAQNAFKFWIGEYYSPKVYRYFQTRERAVKMKNAPFRFFPADWFEFFRAQGWGPLEIKYLVEESLKVGRRIPMPWWGRILFAFVGKEKAAKSGKHLAYVVYGKK